MSQLADRFVHAVASGWHSRLSGLTTDDLTTPAAQESWAQWDPDRWMAEHGRKENDR